MTHNRTIAVYLSLNIEVVDHQQGAMLFTFPLVSLSWLAMLLWGGRDRLTGLEQTVHREWQWVQVQITLFLTVTGIGLRSFLYGFGLPV